jgi:prepilin-type N-terminal cleavage/methylation domain-containing protein
MQKNKNYLGFSLVELLVVIAIVGIIASVTFEILGASRKNVNLENECNNVASVINKARSYALSGRQLTAGSTSVAVSFPGNSTYSVDNLASGTESYSLVRVTSDAQTFSFAKPTGAMTTTGTGTVTLSADGATRTVVVSAFSAKCD